MRLVSGELQTTSLSSELVGVGEMPPSLDRLNWAALLLPMLWALGHGLWSWAGALFGLRVAAFFLAGLLRMSVGEAVLPHLIAGTVLIVGWWALYLTFARRANRLWWEREARQLSRPPEEHDSHEPVSLDRWLRHQRWWTAAGLVLFLLGVVFAHPDVSRVMSHPWLTPMFWLQSAIDVGVLTVTYVWYSLRRRRDLTSSLKRNTCADSGARA